MPLRTSPIQQSQSSIYGHSTPALDHDDARWPDSSSPGVHHLATPTTAARNGAALRSHHHYTSVSTKQQSYTAKRNTRISDSVTFYPLTSPAASGAESSKTPRYHARTVMEHLGATSGFHDAANQVHHFMESHQAMTTSSPPLHELTGTSHTLTTMQYAGAHMKHNSSHSTATSPAHHSAALPSAPSRHRSLAVPHHSYASFEGTSHWKPQARMTAQDSHGAHQLQRDEDARKAQQLRRWAQEDSSSSSEEEDDAQQRSAQQAASKSRRRHLKINTALSPQPGLLPSPFPVPGQSMNDRPPANSVSPEKRASGSDMMDRFMSARPGHDGPAEEGVTDLRRSSRRRTASKGGELPEASPHDRMTGRGNAPLSPAPSAVNQSVLFSPDVAEVLRTELNELEAAKPRLSKRVRTRPVHLENEFVEDVSHQAVSFDQSPAPSDSSTSASMHAPSFCDSSPPMSDRASANVRVAAAHFASHQPHHSNHPASAPEYIYTGLPSSSPLSSHASSLSEYEPVGVAKHRSSPGPSMRPIAPALQRTQSDSTTGTATSAPAEMAAPQPARKRAPNLKRAETSAGIVSADGHAKPNFSYAALIGQAIFSVPEQRISLNDIYTFIMTTYPFYKKEDQGWQNSIRHNLSLNDCFVKTARGHNNPGKGCLWAIVAGCEEQFADGSFVKRGAATSKKASSLAAFGAKSEDGSTSQAPRRNRNSRKRSRDDTPQADPSGKETSPTHSATSTTNSYQYSQVDMAPVQNIQVTHTAASVSKSGRKGRNPDNPPSQLAQQGAWLTNPPTATELPPIPLQAQNRAEATRVDLAGPRSDLEMPAPQITTRKRPRRAEAPDADGEADTVEAEAVEAHTEAIAGVRTRSRQSSHNRAPFAAITASPPTSVYHRLAGPYHPISFSGASSSRRALALLASPEATGIMPARMADAAGPSLGGAFLEEPGLPPFLPGPQLFPGQASPSKHRRTDSDDSLLLRTIVHTQSPTSSVRGSRAGDSSPKTTHTDPEKRLYRAPGTRQIPAVAALADSHLVTDAYRSPPPSRSTRALLRSPGSKGCATPASQFSASLWSTPGPRGSVARLWGMSPGEDGSDGAAWGFDDSLEAELERLGDSSQQQQQPSQADKETVVASGGTNAPKAFWNSPRVGLNGHW
ncbi:Forkhead transcription factor [Microbotryomycetes sp. JL221]|nr:Forkhead transcription factor [Microbotryomycetes sp. JL221]